MRANAWEGIGKELKIKRKFYVSSRDVRIVCPRLKGERICISTTSWWVQAQFDFTFTAFRKEGLTPERGIRRQFSPLYSGDSTPSISSCCFCLATEYPARLFCVCGSKRSGTYRILSNVIRTLFTVLDSKKIRCGLQTRSRAGFWKNDRAAVCAVRIQYNTIQYNTIMYCIIYYLLL
jgi:hypothetical protein